MSRRPLFDGNSDLGVGLGMAAIAFAILAGWALVRCAGRHECRCAPAPTEKQSPEGGARE